MLDTTDKKLLELIADIKGTPKGAFNIRKNAAGIQRATTPNIDIVNKTDKPGIDILIKPGTVGESVHIPVILTKGLSDTVYNTFEVGAGADVEIVAGCGIHSEGCDSARHDGVHEFFVRKGARMKYIERHYGEGDESARRIMNPTTVIEVEEDGIAELEMIQIKGVDDTLRDTRVILHKNARLIVSERLLTCSDQEAESNITVELRGEESSAQVISRSVAQDKSKQLFHLNIRGYAPCRGHIQCDSIIMDEAHVAAIPEISAFHSDAQLIHEAAIGKIASDQLTKLMTLGLDEKEAEERILKGFLQ